MLTMQGVARQGLPHDIQPDASADYSDTGWSGGFERDGSEVYKYISDDDFLKIKIWEQFEEDEYGYIDKEYSSWVTQVWYNDEEQCDLCDLDGMTATESLENVLKNMKYSNLCDLGGMTAIESLHNVLENIKHNNLDGMTATRLFNNVFKKIKHINYVTKSRDGWRTSYQDIAGKVFAPMWI